MRKNNSQIQQYAVHGLYFCTYLYFTLLIRIKIECKLHEYHHRRDQLTRFQDAFFAKIKTPYILNFKSLQEFYKQTLTTQVNE